MKKSWLVTPLFVALVAFSAWPGDASAEGCRVRTPGSYVLGAFIYDQLCDQNENRYVTLGTLLKVEQGVTTTGRFLSTGATDNEFEVCATPCQLLSMSAFSTAATAAFVKCSEAVFGSTTPGTTAIKFDFGVPASTTGAGNNSASIPTTLGLELTALTCWIVDDETDAGIATDSAANKIRVNWAKK